MMSISETLVCFIWNTSNALTSSQESLLIPYIFSNEPTSHELHNLCRAQR